MLSSRLPSSLSTNALSRAVEALRASGEPYCDLTETNPTAVMLPYPPNLLAPLGEARGLCYRPSPRGLAEARAAVAAEYAAGGMHIVPDRLVLTSSTSEAYSVLFKLLCNAGDEVLVPQPSYPLFELLTRLDNVVARPYRLDYHGAWSIDRSSLEAALTPATRAILVVSPNNPTGSMLRAADRDWLVGRCADRGIAIISDEVFADYPLAPRSDAASIAEAGDTAALTFALGGLSKSAGLPQVKLGWMAVQGPSALIPEVLERLELICDTYLSVSTPVQVAAPALIATGRTIRTAIQARISGNLALLREALRRWPATTLLEPEGGWSAVVRVPSVVPEEAMVLDALARARVLVHPGHFFDFDREAFVVVSLLPEPELFRGALDRLLPVIAGDRA